MRKDPPIFLICTHICISTWNRASESGWRGLAWPAAACHCAASIMWVCACAFEIFKPFFFFWAPFLHFFFFFKKNRFTFCPLLVSGQLILPSRKIRVYPKKNQLEDLRKNLTAAMISELPNLLLKVATKLSTRFLFGLLYFFTHTQTHTHTHKLSLSLSLTLSLSLSLYSVSNIYCSATAPHKWNLRAGFNPSAAVLWTRSLCRKREWAQDVSEATHARVWDADKRWNSRGLFANIFVLHGEGFVVPESSCELERKFDFGKNNGFFFHDDVVFCVFFFFFF